MKPEIKALAKIGVAVAALNFAMDMGKACMFKAVREVNPETADEILQIMKDVDKYDNVVAANKRARIKWVRKLCKIMG